MTGEFQPPQGRRDRERVAGVQQVLKFLVLHSNVDPEPYLSDHYRPELKVLPFPEAIETTATELPDGAA